MVRVLHKIRRIRPGQIILILFMLGLVAFTMLPFVYMIVAALKPLDEQLIFPPRFYVQNPTLQNFVGLFRNMDSSVVPFSRYIFNSVFTSALSVFLSVVVCSMAAYSLAKLRVKGGGFIFALVVAGLMFAPQVTQIPTFMIAKNMGLINNYLALIIPKIATAYNLFLMKQFADQIPDPFLEAAKIDGATELTLYWKIAMPLLRPAWATVVVFSFVSNWNDYFSPLIFIQDQALKTLPLALQLIGESGSVATLGIKAAATLCMTLPTVIIFTLMQSNVVKSMAYSGIKG